MNYWELRKLISKIIPRRTQLFSSKERINAVKEKGRKTNYHQFNIEKKEWAKHERLLNLEEVNSFLEISVRAAACPMPLNLDVWDGLLCVVEGQKVLTKKGWIVIEEITVGDEVMSYNEKTSKTEWKEITQTSSTEKEDLIEIDTGEEKLLVTDEHPIYTQRGWVLAKNLTEEDYVLTYGTKFKKIKKIKRIKKKTKVHDITVKDNENFFAEGILVHNCPFACRYCVTSDTLITTPEGKVPIKNLKPGDKVLTYNENTGEIELDSIQDTMNREDEIYILDLGEEKLEITGEHPVYTQRGWIKVSELKEEDQILCLEE